MRNKYYSLAVQDREASINIYGDITSWEWLESDVSSYTLSKEIEGLDVDVLNVYINSYGGEVAEGLAIYNSLKRHKAKVKTYCDGFACSIASVVFMAGDERYMNESSLLMIHNAWTRAAGDADELRKQADDLEKINQAAINAYMSKINITEDKLKDMLDAETWISPQEAVEMGFATAIVEDAKTDNVAANARQALFNKVLNSAPKAEVKITDLLELKSEFAKIDELIATIKQAQEPQNPPFNEPTEEPPKENIPKKLFSKLFN